MFTTRTLRLLLVLALIAAACSSDDSDDAEDAGAAPSVESVDDDLADEASEDDSGDEPDDTPEPEPSYRVVQSDDGNAMVLVPPGDDTPITIDVLAPEDYPEILAGAQRSEGTVIYDLGPDGATFDEPVRFLRRIEVANVSSTAEPLDVPIVLTVTVDDDGAAELLDGQRVLRAGDALYASAEFTHFSPGISVNVQVDAKTNALFGDLIRSVRNADGSQAVDVVDEDVLGLGEAIGDRDAVLLDPRGDIAIRPDDVGLVIGATAGDGPIITGGYEFPTDVDVDAYDSDVVDFLPPESLADFFRPLTLHATVGGEDVTIDPAPAATIGVDAEVTVTNPLFGDDDFEIALTFGALVFDRAPEFDPELAEIIDEIESEPQPSDVEVARRLFAEEFGFRTGVDHSGGRNGTPSKTEQRLEVDVDADGGLIELVRSFEGEVFAFTAASASPGEPARLVDHNVVTVDDDGVAVVETGIDCYCPFVTGIFVSPGEAPPPASSLAIVDDGDGSFSMRFEGSEVLAPGTLFLVDDEPFVLEVGPEEGTAFDGSASFDFEIPAELFRDGFESGDTSAWTTGN